MRKRSIHLVGVLALAGTLVFVTTSPAAAMVLSPQTPAPSGNYLNPWTDEVYFYDSATSSLTPTGETGQLAEYFALDVYDTGQAPDPRTLRVSACPSLGYCLAWRIAMANPLSSQFTIEVVNNDSCLVEQAMQPRSWIYPDRSDRVFHDARDYTFDCNHGWAEAAIYLNGQQVAYDRLQQPAITPT